MTRIKTEFIQAIKFGDLAKVRSILQPLSPTQRSNIIHAKDANKLPEAAFRIAAQNGHLNIINMLIELTSDPIKRSMMICACDSDNKSYAAFRDAAANGRLDIINRLLEVTPLMERNDMIHAANDDAFGWAVHNGHLSVVYKLIELTPDPILRSNIIHARGVDILPDAAFRWAITTSNFTLMNMLVALTPNLRELKDMIHARCANYKPDFAFRHAAANGDLVIMDWLINLTPPNQLHAMIHAINNEPFKIAAKNGHVAVLDKLIALTPQVAHVETMIRSSYFYNYKPYAAFRTAAAKGHLAVINKLIEVTPQLLLDEMIHAANDAAFRKAAKNGHVAIMNRLIELTPDAIQLEQMIHASGINEKPDHIIRWGAAKGALATTYRFIDSTIGLNRVQTMMHKPGKSDQPDYAFRWAIINKHLNAMSKLIEVIPSQATLLSIIKRNLNLVRSPEIFILILSPLHRIDYKLFKQLFYKTNNITVNSLSLYRSYQKFCYLSNLGYQYTELIRLFEYYKATKELVTHIINPLGVDATNLILQYIVPIEEFKSSDILLLRLLSEISSTGLLSYLHTTNKTPWSLFDLFLGKMQRIASIADILKKDPLGLAINSLATIVILCDLHPDLTTRDLHKAVQSSNLETSCVTILQNLISRTTIAKTMHDIYNQDILQKPIEDIKIFFTEMLPAIKLPVIDALLDNSSLQLSFVCITYLMDQRDKLFYNSTSENHSYDQGSHELMVQANAMTNGEFYLPGTIPASQKGNDCATYQRQKENYGKYTAKELINSDGEFSWSSKIEKECKYSAIR
jgi:hypothetical protein